jgi:hypothetical protein
MQNTSKTGVMMIHHTNSFIIRVRFNEYPATDPWLNFKPFQFNKKGHNKNLYFSMHNTLGSMVRHPIGADSTMGRKTF